LAEGGKTMEIGQKRKLNLAAAALAGALALGIGPSASAQLPGGCPRAGADSVDQGYRFTVDSFNRQVTDPETGTRWQIVHCVLNRHSTRNVFVDWPAAGIKGWVRAGSRGSAVRNAPAGRQIDHQDGVLWFGSRPRKRVVTTSVFAAAPAGDAFALARRPGLIRAAWQSVPDAAPESWTSTASIDVPVTAALGPILARIKPRGGSLGAAVLGRSAFKRLVKYVEARPEALVPFEMTFTTEAPADARALRYSCTYRGTAGVLLRFDDPALHRAMFGGAPLVPATGGRQQVMRSQPIAAPAGVEQRTGRLEIVLPDGVTVVGAIGFDYLAPAGT
jgi:hypothetical protein